MPPARPRSRCASTTTAAPPTAASTVATQTFVITVTGVNDAPAGTDNTVATIEDTPYTFTAADFGFTDPNDTPANALQSVLITTLPAAGSADALGQRLAAATEVSVRRHHRRQPEVPAGRQRQRHAVHHLHVPGAGQRRHRATAASISIRPPTR